MSENLWFTNTNADAIGGGDSQKLLSSTAGTSGVAITVTTGGRVWNYQETTSGGRKLTAGTWTLSLPAFSTKANTWVTCTVRVYTDGGVLDQTLWSGSQKIQKSTYAYHEFTSTIGDVTIPENYYLVVFLQRTTGSGTVNMRYNEDVNFFDTKLVTPNTVIEHGSTTTYDVASHLLPAHCLPLTPAAKLYQPPHWRVSTAFDLGVVAFCAATDGTVDNRIASAKFTVTPDAGSYTGTSPDTVTTWSTNSSTGIYDLNKSIDPSDFTADCEATIDIVVTGDEGGTRELTTYYAIDTGTLAQSIAYVDTGGDDGTASVGSEDFPYATIHEAVKDLYAAMGSTLNGAVVKIKPSQDHVWDHLGDTTLYTNNSEWLTLTSWGGDKTDTKLNGTPTYFASKVPLIRLYDIQIGPTNDTFYSEDYAGNKVLVEDCVVDGGSAASVIGFQTTAKFLPEKLYYYNTELKDIRDAIKPRLFLQDLTLDKGAVEMVSLCNAHDIARDFVTLMTSVAIVGNTVTTIDRGIPAYHADLFQFEEDVDIDNVVIYANTCTDIDSQLLLTNRPTGFRKLSNFAFVANYIHIADDADSSPFWSAQGDLFHLIHWNMTWDYDQPTAPAGRDVFQSIGVRRDLTQPRDHVGFGVSFMGNAFAYFQIHDQAYEPLADGMNFLCDLTTNVKHNNYYYSPSEGPEGQTPGSDATTDNPRLNSSGYPSMNGALAARMSPIIATDLAGTTRSDPTAVGAYESDPAYHLAIPGKFTLTPTRVTNIRPIHVDPVAPARLIFRPVTVTEPAQTLDQSRDAKPAVFTLQAPDAEGTQWFRTGRRSQEFDFNTITFARTRCYLETMIRAQGGTAYAQLYDVTDDVFVTDSLVSTTSTSYTRRRSAPITVVDGHDYEVMVGEEVGSGAEAYGAKLIWA